MYTCIYTGGPWKSRERSTVPFYSILFVIATRMIVEDHLVEVERFECLLGSVVLGSIRTAVLRVNE